jgi:hypothetical protein
MRLALLLAALVVIFVIVRSRRSVEVWHEVAEEPAGP